MDFDDIFEEMYRQLCEMMELPFDKTVTEEQMVHCCREFVMEFMARCFELACRRP